MRIELKTVKISSLLPHESVIEQRVEEIMRDIEENGLRFPIIVDRNNRIIIDGHHRVEAFRRLGLSRIPALLVDYLDDEIELKRWYYVYSRREESIDLYYSNSLEIVTKVVRRIVHNLRPGPIETVIKTIRSITKIYHDNLQELYWLLYRATSDLPLVKIPEDSYDGELPVIYTPVIYKQIVIQYAKQRTLLPPKTTRHITGFMIPEISYKIQRKYIK